MIETLLIIMQWAFPMVVVIDVIVVINVIDVIFILVV